MGVSDQHEAALSPKLRLAALGGVIGPAAFIGGWTVGAAIASDAYSSIDDAISRLAAVGAGSRPVMTAGFIGFGIALPLYAMALRRAIEGGAWVTATAAGIGCIALAATPLLAARPLLRQGHRALAGLGIAAGAVSGVSLLLASSSLPTGFFQRLGLTAADFWIAASAVAVASGAVRPIPPCTPSCVGAAHRRSSPARGRIDRRWS